jgi:GT2 family glycosyltransferase
MPIGKKPLLISVVMLNYNGLNYLKRTIHPILNLAYPNFEFIIVDNGSTDGSLEYIREFKEIVLIEVGKNLGYSKGKNIGVKNAKGEFILLLDNDILINDQNLLNKLNSLSEKYNSFIQPVFVDFGDERTKHYGIFYSIYGTNWHKHSLHYTAFKDCSDLIPIGASAGGVMFFKKDIFVKIGYFDESQMFNLDDFEIGMRLWIMGHNVYLYTKTNVTHLGVNHSKNVDNYSNRFKLMFSGKARAIIKNYRMKNILFLFPIMLLFLFLKSIRFSFKKRSFKIFFAFLWSVSFFIKNLSDTLKQRKIIQSKRVINEDVFLKIKPPKFD